MNGAESLVRTLLAHHVDVCFSNPGTSEMHFVGALDRVEGMRCVLGLFEGVVTGAADGYWRMKERPACTLLHLGPGLANGLANLHNAKKASSGIVNIVGEHATWHLEHNAPLTSDIEGLARPMSAFVRTTKDADSVAQDTHAAIQAAHQWPGQIATLILPGDAAWNELQHPSKSYPSIPIDASLTYRPPSQERIEKAAAILRQGEPTLLLLAGRALRREALQLAGQIAGKTTCRLASHFFSARIARGAGGVTLERIPYAVAPALEMLQGFRHIITVETREPIAFFGYPDRPSLLKPAGCSVHALCDPGEDSGQALDALAHAVGAQRKDAPLQAHEPLDPASLRGALDPISIAYTLRAMIPEGAILVDESLTTGRQSMALTSGAAPHEAIQNMGGSIGFSPPVATGAAIACPDRRVLCLVGDGSSLYTIQALWTQAREKLPVLTLVFANRAYQILKAEFANVLAGSLGQKAKDMLEIDRPTLDFVSLARGFGVPGIQVRSVEELVKAMRTGLSEPGPFLIEVVV